MDTMMRKPASFLQKKSKRGFRGYPVATVAFYGPDDRRASKLAVGIVASESGDVVDLKRWSSDQADVRWEPTIAVEVEQFIRGHAALSVVMSDRIIGCPHEETIDYPEGKSCPQCPYWAGRDRFSGERIE
jgi:hypothetical protein